MPHAATAIPEPSVLSSTKLLIVEPDPEIALSLGAHLARAGADATVVRNLDAAHRELDGRGEDLHGVMVDLDEDLGSASRILTSLRARANPCFGIAVTRGLDADSVRSLLLRGALEVIRRPAGPITLMGAMERAVRATTQLRSNVLDRPKRRRRRRKTPHLSVLESPERRVSFELEGAVSALANTVRLTTRESQVLRLIAKGYRYQEIGEELSISTRTVKLHSANLRKKTGVRNRYELLRKVLGTQA